MTLSFVRTNEEERIKIIGGTVHFMNTLELGVTSSLLRIPMYLPEMFLPVGGVLLCLALVLQIIDGGIHKGGEHI